MRSLDLDLDSASLRVAFGAFPSGVTALCALVDGAPVGMTVSSFTSVSLRPALVSVCMAMTSTTWSVLRQAPHLGLSVLGSDHGPLCRQMSGSGDRFDGVTWDRGPGGAVFLPGSPLYLDTTLEGEVEAGDHWIVLLEVRGIEFDPDAAPLVFHRSRFCGLAH